MHLIGFDPAAARPAGSCSGDFVEGDSDTRDHAAHPEGYVASRLAGRDRGAIEVNMIPVARTRPLVLNVDDDAANRYVKTRSLLLGEMEVIEAETGTAALALIAE